MLDNENLSGGRPLFMNMKIVNVIYQSIESGEYDGTEDKRCRTVV